MNEKALNGQELWVGFDLDGTIAYFDWGTYKPGVIGPPILSMVARIRAYRRDGMRVKIFTARASASNPDRDKDYAAYIPWIKDAVGEVLEWTAEKDQACIRIYDDRAVQVMANEGYCVPAINYEPIVVPRVKVVE